MSSDIICNMLFHLVGLHTRYYRPSLDILNKTYRCPKRIALDKYNYDAIRNLQQHSVQSLSKIKPIMEEKSYLCKLEIYKN